MSTYLDCLRAWAEVRSEELASRGVRVNVTDSPAANEKRSAWIDMDSSDRVVQLVVWETGEMLLSVGDVETGEVIVEESRVALCDSDLDDWLELALSWVTQI